MSCLLDFNGSDTDSVLSIKIFYLRSKEKRLDLDRMDVKFDKHMIGNIDPNVKLATNCAQLFGEWESLNTQKSSFVG
jgi:hypothetical protein